MRQMTSTRSFCGRFVGVGIAIVLAAVLVDRPADAQTTTGKSGTGQTKTGGQAGGGTSSFYNNGKTKAGGGTSGANSGNTGGANGGAGNFGAGSTGPGAASGGAAGKSGSFNNGASQGTGGTSGVGAAANQKGGPVGAQPAVARQNAPPAIATPQAPSWIPLAPEHEKYLDEVLNYWQHSSANVKRYRSKFTRWEYDGTWIKPDPTTGELPAKTQATGVIKYASPDKGMFKVEQVLYYTPGQKAGEKAKYLPHQDDRGEEWVCDGKSVFSLDHQKKQLIQTELPPDMQGRAIVDGPLPFMFGAEAAKIKQRFWLRIITPKDTKGEYWLEAVPKTRSDATNFKLIHIIIDETDFLPKAMAIFDRSYDPVKNPSCTNFVFEKREVNWNDTLDKLKVFQGEFWEPSAPFGYKKVVERYQAAPDNRVPAPGPGGPTPTGPQSTVPKTAGGAIGPAGGNPNGGVPGGSSFGPAPQGSSTKSAAGNQAVRPGTTKK